MISELLILLVALAICWGFLTKRDRNFPPGPIELPLLGHLPMLGMNPHKTLCKWKRTYGPIIGIRLGSYRTVVISDVKLFRQAMNMNCFSGRPRLNVLTVGRTDENGNVGGIASADGHFWIEQRRFAIKNLRDFATGTKTIEAKIQEEMQEFLHSLVGSKEGKPIQVKHLFNAAVLNVLWRITFGDRMTREDPDHLAAYRAMTQLVDDTPFGGGLPIMLPWLAKIAPTLSGYNKMMMGYPTIYKFVEQKVESHIKDYVEHQPRDFVDAYSDKVSQTTDPNSSFHVSNNSAMINTLVDLYVAGGETSSTTLSWLCIYLIYHPQVQKKLQDEIDEVVGRRVPALADRPSMPYTEAVLSEVLRFSTMFPLSVFHRATEDVEFEGFRIPKDTMICGNLYEIHFDETIWGDPQNFRPERFIDSNGKFNKNENLLPFSTGKRACIGESVARDELFLFSTSFFQVYSASSAGKLPNLEPDWGVILMPKPFEMILTRRIP